LLSNELNMNFETSIIYSFTQIANNFRYNFDSKMNEINLHGGQIFILISLWKNDRQSQIDLATNLNLSAPTINKMVKSLVKSGFVSCNKCHNDNRMMRVHLTQKGIEHQKLIEEKFVEFETEFFSNITETEKLILTQIFEKINNNFTKKKSINRVT
jgi:MarR family transcriptional regulator, organic hydroperoxide resistance regulator